MNAAANGDPADLQALMRRLWPDNDKYRIGRNAVWAWIKRLQGTE